MTAQLAQLASCCYRVVYSLFGLLWTGAVVVTTDGYLRGEPPTLNGVYGRARPGT